MRWLSYFILAYVALGVQAGVGAAVQVGAARPNVVLLAAIFVALNAPREPALLGCFVLGLLQDLLTTQPLGLYALSYGLVGMFVISTQEIVYREHVLTHVSLALVGGLMTGLVLVAHGWMRSSGVTVGMAFFSALYTAVAAPVVMWGLNRLRKAFGFQTPRRRLG